jgi:hypothetical protein
MRNSLRAALLACSALVATPVMAQQIQPTPPEHYTLGARGVDLVQGTFNYSTTDLVIGQPGQGGIAMGRIWTSEGWRDNLAGTIAVSPAALSESDGRRLLDDRLSRIHLRPQLQRPAPEKAR